MLLAFNKKMLLGFFAYQFFELKKCHSIDHVS